MPRAFFVWQALENLLAGWKHYVLGGFQKGYENAYPLGYVTATERLYQKAVDARRAGGDPSEFAREHFLPLLGIEPPPRVVYGWTEQDVLVRWDELRSWGEVKDQDMPMEDALKLLEEALARVTYTPWRRVARRGRHQVRGQERPRDSA